ncbi:DUF4334 domain-containing protein [Saccharibacillus kuerlensis]|uniref:DUF4334 domain-containing protein n=1 Tax=Saccharibacillus kuerlensis TaxID=459527 RepID=A0ABQ2L6L6_9BACL|nr:DUF4334 domain-containing protein [Saccharibacillus kuerlensis]GGO01846.1 hypothetical protein GCM10010969_24550 [Saccharibacillus kuerlensis]
MNEAVNSSKAKDRLNQMLSSGASQDEAFALFDTLEAAVVHEMWDLWKGEEIVTGHPLEGLLTSSGWYGKMFESPEHVHPLVFQKKNGELYAVNPLWIPLKLPFDKIPRSPIGPAMTLMRPILRTRKSAARLRQIEYRGKSGAAMVYDRKDIIDVFRKVDDNTLMAIMDVKSLPSDKTYFFVLHRVKGKEFTP